MELRKVNLNLLLHLNVLLDESSVSNAAKRSFLTQTAMSNILKQLREVFLDELFVREGNEFKPTAFAVSLHPKVKAILQDIEQLLVTESFNPETDKFTFKVAFASHGEYMFLPKISEYITKNAPNVSLKVLPLTASDNISSDLAEDIHLAIAPSFYNVGPNLIRESLLIEEPRCFMHVNHPLANSELTLDQYFNAQHVAIVLDSSDKQTYIDKLLVDYQYKRQVKIYAPNLVSAIYCLYDSELIGTFPIHLTKHLKGKHELSLRKVPFAYEKQSIDLIYHRRFLSYSPVVWLINLIKELSTDLVKK